MPRQRLRQRRGDGGQQHFRVLSCALLSRHDGGDERGMAGAVLHRGTGVAELRQRCQGGVHLGEFDAVTADLGLIIDPAPVLQLIASTQQPEVAGAVHRLTGVRRVGEGGAVGHPEVAQAHSPAGDADLADGTGGSRCGATRLQDADAAASQRRAEADLLAAVGDRLGQHPAAGDEHRGLGGAVHVVQLQLPADLCGRAEQIAGGAGRQRLTDRQPPPHMRQTGEVGRGGEHDTGQ